MTVKVVVSLEAETGDRLVEILRTDDDRFAFRECERNGTMAWRKMPQRLPQVYPSYAQALDAARSTIVWLHA